MMLKRTTSGTLITLLLLLAMGFIAPATAAVVNVDVTEDGYVAMGSSWYMDRAYAKAWEFSSSEMDALGYVKFDISDDLAGYTADMITSASFVFYKTPQQGAGLPPVPLGTTGTFALTAYADAHDAGPGYVGDTVTYAYTATADYEWISIDITDIVEAWLDGTYTNYGMEISKPGYDGYAWYWTTMEGDEGYQPYLSVTAVPPARRRLAPGKRPVRLCGHWPETIEF